MHMADALVSPAVAAVTGAAAVILTAVAARKTKRNQREDLIPLMGVMGAFIFAAQMINFSIPGTGSSGHIIGGVLLAAVLGPWSAFITLTSVLIIQCLVFADGGLMALGCNIINMAATSCLIAYPLVYKPIANGSTAKWRILLASLAACVVGLEAGACLVTAETELSGVTALPGRTFLALMSSIHLAIGIGEGLATAAVLSFIAANRPEMLKPQAHAHESTSHKLSKGTKVVLWSLGGVALVLAGCFSWIASEDPDGLEWSIAKLTGVTELGEAVIPSTAVMPDYDSTFAGIIGGVIVMVTLWALCAVLFRHRPAHKSH